ncbi:MAG: thiol-disulfide oxidoreductase DCC family protein [Planctomycetota bacterium]
MNADREQPLILFDGDCNLCNGSVQFVIKRDPQAKFRFAALQSDAARSALVAAGVTGELPDSIVLVADGRVRTRSAAALAIARRLGGLWPLLSIFWLIPYPLRDLVYDWIARNRYRWFGKQETCWVPTTELRVRFLDADSRRPREAGGATEG